MDFSRLFIAIAAIALAILFTGCVEKPKTEDTAKGAVENPPKGNSTEKTKPVVTVDRDALSDLTDVVRESNKLQAKNEKRFESLEADVAMLKGKKSTTVSADSTPEKSPQPKPSEPEQPPKSSTPKKPTQTLKSPDQTISPQAGRSVQRVEYQPPFQTPEVFTAWAMTPCNHWIPVTLRVDGKPKKNDCPCGTSYLASYEAATKTISLWRDSEPTPKCRHTPATR